MRKIKNYREFTNSSRINEEVNFQDLKRGLKNLGSKISSGISKGAALATLVSLMASNMASAQDWTKVKQEAENAGYITRLCGFSTMDKVEKNCTNYSLEEQVGNLGGVIAYHKVKPGETVYSISKLYEMSPEVLVQQNKIVNNVIKVGQELRVPLVVLMPDSESEIYYNPYTDPKSPKIDGDDEYHTVFNYGEEEVEPTGGDSDFQKWGVYRMKKGESLYQISKKTGLPVDYLQMNMIGVEDPTKVKELQEINLPMHYVNMLNGDMNSNIPTTNYKVKQGDTFRKIADDLGTSVETLLRINGRLKDYEEPNIKLNMGDIIKVPAN